MVPAKTRAMQTILALIFTYLVFVTPTWAATRLVVLIDVALAIVYDFTPLRARLGIVETIGLSCAFALWVLNMILDRGRRQTL